VASRGLVPPNDSYIFRTSARDQLQTEFLAAEIAKRGLKRPALLVDKSARRSKRPMARWRAR